MSALARLLQHHAHGIGLRRRDPLPPLFVHVCSERGVLCAGEAGRTVRVNIVVRLPEPGASLPDRAWADILLCLIAAPVVEAAKAPARSKSSGSNGGGSAPSSKPGTPGEEKKRSGSSAETKQPAKRGKAAAADEPPRVALCACSSVRRGRQAQASCACFASACCALLTAVARRALSTRPRWLRMRLMALLSFLHRPKRASILHSSTYVRAAAVASEIVNS